MNKSSGIRLISLMAIIWLAAAPFPAEAQGNPPVTDYVIGPGDVLNISV
jgi:hypothetical protein